MVTFKWVWETRAPAGKIPCVTPVPAALLGGSLQYIFTPVSPGEPDQQRTTGAPVWGTFQYKTNQGDGSIVLFPRGS